MAADSSPPWRDDVPAAVEVWSEGDRTVIGLFGEHDTGTEAEVSDALGRFCGPGSLGDVVVDLSEATFVDSATIAALLGGRNLMVRQGRSLVLRAPSPQARRVLALCGLLIFVEPATGGPEPDPTNAIPPGPADEVPYVRSKLASAAGPEPPPGP